MNKDIQELIDKKASEYAGYVKDISHINSTPHLEFVAYSEGFKIGIKLMTGFPDWLEQNFARMYDRITRTEYWANPGFVDKSKRYQSEELLLIYLKSMEGK